LLQKYFNVVFELPSPRNAQKRTEQNLRKECRRTLWKKFFSSLFVFFGET
jgi:hypothetical protein